jgi:hypothetical protein
VSVDGRQRLGPQFGELGFHAYGLPSSSGH